MMKFVILSLFFFTATVTGRLRHFKGRKQEVLQKTRANETFFAKNEIVPTMMVAIENEKVAPFELVNVTDSNVTLQYGRDLQSVNSVTIMNQCASQGFWLVIIYTESGTGLVQHKGWYSIPPNHQEHFNDVVDGIYSFYAVSFDRRYEWGAPNPDTAKYCFNGRCYQDYDFSDSSSSFHYLNCYGPSPTPAPVWSPTPAPVLSPTPAPIAISSRAQDWVNSHNTRRASIHSQFGKSFIALNWSDRLAYSAQGYADRLASITWSDCHIQHGYQGDSYGGENIAATWGSQSFDFPDPEDVLTQWFEDEENDPWPQNGHRTQVAWRGTGFVGCGEARKVYNGDLYCKIQVCRYLAPGNCNVGSAGEGLDTYMMDDYTPCGPQSPYT